MNKRYAIVRVDDTCPSGHDGCKVNLVCVQADRVFTRRSKFLKQYLTEKDNGK